MNRVVKAIFLISLIFIPTKVLAYDYSITSYNADLTVNENNVIDIRENISVYFSVPKHGILRQIPLRNKVERLDGTTSYNRIKINNIGVSDNYSVYNENGNKVIKIGDADRTLTGSKDYAISYSYNLGKDTGKDYDELYFNIIGGEWDTTIKNVTFKIVMPKEFDESKLGFSSGAKYSTNNKNVYYDVDGDTIIGGYNGTLNPGEALTVRLELPEGYFVGASNNWDLIMMLSLIVPIIFVIIAFLMWLKYGKDDKVVETVEFYPPEGINSAELGFFYNGQTKNEDIVSLIVYLANKGYLSITEVEGKSIFSKKNSFKLTMLKEYDGNNEIERIFFDGLFEYGTEVQEIELTDSFYKTLNKISAITNKKENKLTIFEKNSLSKGIFVTLMMIATFVLISIKPLYESTGNYASLMSLIFPSIALTVLYGVLLRNPPNKGFVIFFFSIWGGVPLLGTVFPGLLVDVMYAIIYVIGIACMIAMGILHKVMLKRNTYGNKMLGKIKGFRNFLEIAEKPKLEELVMQDPKYFYNILPFAYVLGVSDKWIEKFETIIYQAPDWYGSSETFSMASFSGFMDRTMSSAKSSMSSRPSSSSSGDGGSSDWGSSGGGSSGGGSGGGGGSSW